MGRRGGRGRRGPAACPTWRPTGPRPAPPTRRHQGEGPGHAGPRRRARRLALRRTTRRSGTSEQAAGARRGRARRTAAGLLERAGTVMAWRAGRREDAHRLLGDRDGASSRAGGPGARTQARAADRQAEVGVARDASNEPSSGWSGPSERWRASPSTRTPRCLPRSSDGSSSSSDGSATTQARIEQALDAAEALQLPEVLAQALITKSLVLAVRGRSEEARILLQHALQVSLDNDLPLAALRASRNMGAFLERWNRYEEPGSGRLEHRPGPQVRRPTLRAHHGGGRHRPAGRGRAVGRGPRPCG